MYDVSITDEIKSNVAMEMNKSCNRAVFFDLMTCDFHAGLTAESRKCSLFAAHRAV